MFEVDHVIYVVGDLPLAAEDFERRYGLVALPGGVHPGGTANRVIPLRSSQYIELLGVNDEAAIQEDPFGRTLLKMRDEGGALLAWALRTDDLDAFAARVGVEPEAGSIVDDEGRTSSWRTVEAVDDARGALPFLIAYDADPASRRTDWDQRFVQASHPSGATHIGWLEVAVNEERLSGWLGDNDLPFMWSPTEKGSRR